MSESPARFVVSAILHVEAGAAPAAATTAAAAIVPSTTARLRATSFCDCIDASLPCRSVGPLGRRGYRVALEPQSAPLSQSRVWMTACTFEPSAFITTTSAAPSGPVPGVRAETILVPSGENPDERYCRPPA